VGQVVAAQHGALPGVRLPGPTLDGVICIRLDAAVTFAHFAKNAPKPRARQCPAAKPAS
jgi:hypothetical protein